MLKIKHQWYSLPIRWYKEEHHQVIVSSRWCSLRQAQCMYSLYLVLFHLTLQITFLMSRRPLLWQLVISHPPPLYPVRKVQKPVVYCVSEQIPILKDIKTPDKGPQETDQKKNFKRTKNKPQENNVDGVSGGYILVEENLIKKSCKVVVGGDRVVKIV